MLRQAIFCSRYGFVSQIRNQSTQSASTIGKWDLLVGVQVERLPIITKTLNKIERDYQVLYKCQQIQRSECNMEVLLFQDFLSQLEFEQSYKSDFELRFEKDMRTAKLLKEGKIKIDLDAGVQKTATDAKDMWKSELNSFQPASRTTAADQSNDLKSLERKLDASLTLIIEQKLGKESLFLLPQGKIAEGENLYEAAQRVIKDVCGSGIQTMISGHAPCGFYKYKYPKELRSEKIGAKVFFYRAQFIAGQVDSKQGPFEWLDKAELFHKIDKFADYKKSLSKFII